MRIITTITDEQKENMLVDTLRGLEMDLYIHNLNKARYQDILANLPAGVDFIQKIEGYIAQIDSRLIEVNTTLEALDKQMPVGIDIPAVLARVKAKEEAAVTLR